MSTHYFIHKKIELDGEWELHADTKSQSKAHRELYKLLKPTQKKYNYTMYTAYDTETGETEVAKLQRGDKFETKAKQIVIKNTKLLTNA